MRAGEPPAAAQGLREGHAPPLQTMANAAAKKVGRHHTGERREGCPHPAGPRGVTNVSILKAPWCGGRERPPYRFGKTRRPPRRIHAAIRPRADMESAPTAEGWAGGQPGNLIPLPRRKPCRGRFYIGPACGGAGSRGRIWNPPGQFNRKRRAFCLCGKSP